jgi:hypothetical protein
MATGIFPEQHMRVLVMIALLIAAAFMLLFSLARLARDMARHSFQVPPDLNGIDDWDVAADEFTDATPPLVDRTERRSASRHPIGRMRGEDIPGKSNALDDWRSAL